MTNKDRLPQFVTDVTLIVNHQEGRNDWVCQTKPCGKKLQWPETWKISGNIIASFVTSGGKMGMKKSDLEKKNNRMGSDKEWKM